MKTFDVLNKDRKIIGKVKAKDFYYAEDVAIEKYKDKYGGLMISKYKNI